MRSLASAAPPQVALEGVVGEFAWAAGSGVRSNSDTASSACSGVGPDSAMAAAVASILPKSAPALSNTSGSMSSPSSSLTSGAEGLVLTLTSASGGGGPSSASGSISSCPAGCSCALEYPSEDEGALTCASGAACAGAGRPAMGSPPSMGASTGRSARGSRTGRLAASIDSGLVTYSAAAPPECAYPAMPRLTDLRDGSQIRGAARLFVTCVSLVSIR